MPEKNTVCLFWFCAVPFHIAIFSRRQRFCRDGTILEHHTLTQCDFPDQKFTILKTFCNDKELRVQHHWDILCVEPLVVWRHTSFLLLYANKNNFSHYASRHWSLWHAKFWGLGETEQLRFAISLKITCRHLTFRPDAAAMNPGISATTDRMAAAAKRFSYRSSSYHNVSRTCNSVVNAGVLDKKVERPLFWWKLVSSEIICSGRTHVLGLLSPGRLAASHAQTRGPHRHSGRSQR